MTKLDVSLGQRLKQKVLRKKTVIHNILNVIFLVLS